MNFYLKLKKNGNQSIGFTRRRLSYNNKNNFLIIYCQKAGGGI